MHVDHHGATAAVLLLLATTALGARSETAPTVRLLTDFTPASGDLGWYVVNDTVMGGRSQGGFEPVPGALWFTGRTDTNGGGFSSIRTDALDLDLSEHDGLRVRVRGDGRRYTWRITTDARWRGRRVAFRADFETQDGVWTDVDLPFAGFSPSFRGTELTGPTLDAASISGMGVMIADGLDGGFELLIDRVAAYGAPDE